MKLDIEAIAGVECPRCKAMFAGDFCACVPADVLALAEATLPILGAAAAEELGRAAAVAFTLPVSHLDPAITISTLIGHRVRHRVVYEWPELEAPAVEDVYARALTAWRRRVRTWVVAEDALLVGIAVAAEILRRIRSLQPATVEKLARALHFREETVEAALERLERTGLISRKKRTVDCARCKRLEKALAAAGIKVVE